MCVFECPLLLEAHSGLALAANVGNPPLVPNAALTNPEISQSRLTARRSRIADLDGPQIKRLLWQEMLKARKRPYVNLQRQCLS